MLKQKHSEYRGFRRAGVRLTEELLPNLIHRSDKIVRTLYAVHMFDKAHLVMLIEESLIPRPEGIAMLKALREMETEGIEKVRLDLQTGIYTGEQFLIRRLGEEVGGRIHLGRSSGDLTAVSTRITLRDALLMVLTKIEEFRRVLIDTAAQNLDTVMPGFTHGQHAQPTTYGHQLLAWVSVLERDFDRLRGNYQHVNQSPAGAAIMTGSSFPLNRHRTAELLGFDRPIKNTFDAILSHDFLLETHANLAILHANLLRWSEDLMFWSTNDVNMIDIPDRFCGTSSIMMQKKNPYATQEIKGAGAEAIGGLMTAFMVEKDPTGFPILDRSYSRQGAYRSIDTALRDMNWLVEMIPAIKPRKGLMEERAGAWWAQATDLAAALVAEKNLPWRSAHQIVGITVRLALERNIPPREISPELLDEAAILYFDHPVSLSKEAFQRALDPRCFVQARTLYGGPGPEEVRERLDEYESALSGDAKFIEGAEQKLTEASQKLEAAIDTILKG